MNTQILPLPDNRRTWIIYAVLLGSLAWLCFGGLRHHLLDTHDAQSFADHLRIDQDWTFFFSPDKTHASGRPFAEAVKYAVYRLWGNDPAAFHLAVVVIHALASLLLALACRRLGGDLELALLGGLLFLVNVTHFRAVHWISVLDYPLALVCALLSLRAYLDYLDTRSRRSWILFALTLLLGLMAHLSTAVVVPFVLFHRWRQGAELRVLGGQVLVLGVPLAGALGVLLAITSHETSTWGSIGEYAERSLVPLVFGMGRMLLWLVSRLLTTAHWLPLPIHQLQTWELFLGGTLLVGLLVVIWKQVGPVWPWAFWLLLSLVPFLLLTETTILDLPAGPSRYLYPTSAGSSLLLAWLLREGVGRLRRRRRGLFVGLLVLVLLSSYRSLWQAEAISLYTSGRCYIAQGDESTGVRQLRRALDRAPGVIPLEDAYLRLCMVLAYMGREGLEPHLEAGLKAFPENSTLGIYRLVMESVDADPKRGEYIHAKLKKAYRSSANADLIARTYYNWGKGFSERESHQEAILAYRRSLEFAPEKVETLKELGISLMKRGDAERAASAFQRVLEQAPDDHQALYGAALALRQQGEWRQAIALCERLEQIWPEAPSFLLLGECLEQTGRHAAASAAYQRGISHHPEDGQLYLQLARSLLATGDRPAAVQALEQAAHLMPGKTAIFRDLGYLYLREQRFADAVEAYRTALAQQPDSAAQFNLGLALLAEGEIQEAQEVYARGVRDFGADEAVRIGAVDGLQSLIAQGIHPTAARQILDAHWPER